MNVALETEVVLKVALITAALSCAFVTQGTHWQ